MFLTAIRHRELIVRLVKRDLKVRYKGSTLGFLWSVAKPLLLVVIYAFVFDKILKVPLDANFPYSLYIMAGLLPWFYFANSVAESMHVILANGGLIKKIALPHEVFPIATVLGNLVHFLFALPVLFAFMALVGIEPSWPVLWLPVIVLIETLLVLAFALLVSALNVFYRDIASAFEVIITGWLYATPIIYPMALVARGFGYGGQSTSPLGHELAGGMSSWGLTLYMLNPMTPLVLAYRRILLYAAPVGSDTAAPTPECAAFSPVLPDLWLASWVEVSAATTLVLLIVGLLVFRRYAKYFADEV